MHAAVVKVSADGSAIVYAKILAGSGQDSAASVVADASGDALVAGLTSSPDFPVTAAALQTQLAGLQNAFLTRLDPLGNVSFSTYLGGSGKDSAVAVQADAAGNIYLAGATTSLDFPTTAGTVQPGPLVPLWDTKPGGFIAKVAPDGGSLRYATYFAAPVALSLGAGGDLYVAGGAGPGGPFSVTPSAPLSCIPGGPEQAAADFVAHLDANGALLDATYVNLDITAPMGFAWTSGNSVVMAAGGQAAQVVFGGPGWISAPCMTLSALNAATLDPTPVVPGEFLTFLGFGIGPALGVAGDGGVQVLFDGTPAPVLYAQSGQVNVQAPFELSGQTSTEITLTYGGATFGPVTVPLRFAYPGLFRLQPGVTAQAAVRNQDGSVNGPANPAASGSVVMFWGTGFPATSPACATGGQNTNGPVNLAAGFTVQMQGGGPVLYAGGAPTLACGVVRIDMQVPTGVLSGPRVVTPEVCTNGGNTCTGPQTGSTIYIK